MNFDYFGQKHPAIEASSVSLVYFVPGSAVVTLEDPISWATIESGDRSTSRHERVDGVRSLSPGRAVKEALQGSAP